MALFTLLGLYGFGRFSLKALVFGGKELSYLRRFYRLRRVYVLMSHAAYRHTG